MNDKRDRLKQLRQRAEVAMKSMSTTVDTPTDDIDALVHELHVYHVELELQIEDLQQAYQQLETTRQKYKSLFTYAPISYVTTDFHGVILDANLLAVGILGKEPALLKNITFSEMVTEEYQDIYHLHRRAVINLHQPQNCELQIRRNDGTIFFAQLQTHLPDSKSKILYTAIIDISASKQVQDVLQHTLAHEKELNQLRTRVLSVIEHEFRTPLAAILSSIELLERYSDRMDDEKKSSRYRTIHNMIWYLNDIVQEIHSAQDLNNELPSLNPRPFELISFVRQLIADMLTLSQHERQILLQTDEPTDGGMVTWDENLLRRIVMNLINNALKYSIDEIVCHINMTVDTVHIKIEDRGAGISEEDQQYIYEAFYRGTSAEFISGTGIGLYVVAQAVKAHSGKVYCESIVDEGTTFHVELPRHVALNS